MIEVQIKWAANPFRGDKFAAAWLPAAEAVLDYGATSWSFTRSKEGGLDFVQRATFPSIEDFERYWYSERIAQARIDIQGWYQVPLLPTFWDVVGEGRALVPLESD